MMKKKLLYAAPSSVLCELAYEENFLVSLSQDQDVPDLTEETGWGDSIWG